MDNFKYFVKRVNHYKDKFNLNDWRFYFELEEDPDYRASNTISVVSHIATIFFNEGYGWRDKKDIDDSAKHEVIHVLIGKVTCLMESRYVTEGECTQANEETVRKLETLL